MTGHTRRKPRVPAPAPQRTAAAHASGADEFSYRFAKLEGLAHSHPKEREATEFLTQARKAFNTAFSALTTILDEVEAIVRGMRYAKVLQRIQADSEAVSKESERATSRQSRLRSELVRIEDLLGLGLANIK